MQQKDNNRQETAPEAQNDVIQEQGVQPSTEVHTREAGESKEKKKKNPTFIILIVVIGVLIAAGAFLLGRMWYLKNADNNDTGVEVYYSETSAAVRSGESKNAQVENPVDFASLQEQNSELYAWINVPGTRVNYPIAQSASDDEFYLHHDYLKNYLFAGTPYTEFCNKKDFSDPITLVYGHNMYESEGTMFTTLHSFEDAAFFEEHDVFYIYMPKRKLTYRIFSAFKFDNRHIMNSYQFDIEPKDLEEFQNIMLSPHSSVKNVRSGVKLDKNSKVVVLSTCVSGDKSSRYLVCGVLEKDEPTK